MPNKFLFYISFEKLGSQVYNFQVTKVRRDTMAARCDLCGKGPVFGNNVSHANNRTRRKWKPNLHKAYIIVNGQKKAVKVCTKCYRKLRKSQ